MDKEKGLRILNVVEQLASCLAASDWKFIGFGFNTMDTEPEQKETLADFDWSPAANWSEAKLRFLHKSKIHFVNILNNPDKDTLVFSYLSEPQSMTTSSAQQSSSNYSEPECVTFAMHLDDYLELPSSTQSAAALSASAAEEKLKEDFKTQFVQKVCELVAKSSPAQQPKQDKPQRTIPGPSLVYPNAGGIGMMPRIGGGHGTCGSGSGGGMIFVPPSPNRRGPPYRDPMLPRMPPGHARYDPIFPPLGHDDLYGPLPRNLNPSGGGNDFRPHFYPRGGPGSSGLEFPPDFEDFI